MSVNPDSIPRYAMPTPAELEKYALVTPTCGNCVYCKPCDKRHVCVYETFQADTFDELRDALIAYVKPTDDVCTDWKELR